MTKTRALARLAVAATRKRRLRGQWLRWLIVIAGLKEDKCEHCGQLPIWNAKPLVIQVHHKDGDETNNAVENLDFACPNCHSQTDGYAGRSIGHYNQDVA